MTADRARATVTIQSCVGGGPMERLAQELGRSGVATRVQSQFGPERWRALMAAGPRERLLARVGAMGAFPLVASLRPGRGRVAVPTTNPFFLPFALVATRRVHRRAVVPLVYDLYPDILEASGVAPKEGKLAKLASAMNRYWLRRADGVVFIGTRMANHVRARYAEPRRWTVIETGADMAEFATVRGGPADTAAWCGDRIVFTYVGNLGHVHDWETMAEAIPALLERANGRAAVVVAASGPGVARLRDAWKNVSDANVRFLPPLDDDDWRWLLVRSDVALVTLRAEAALTSIPSKTFSAMAACNTVLAVAPRESDLADVIDAHDCGIRVDPGDVDGFVAAASGLASDRGRVRLRSLQARAEAAVRDHYDMKPLAARWAAFLRDAADLPEPA